MNDEKLTPDEMAEEKRLYETFRGAGLDDYAAYLMAGTISAVRRAAS